MMLCRCGKTNFGAQLYQHEDAGLVTIRRCSQKQSKLLRALEKDLKLKCRLEWPKLTWLCTSVREIILKYI